MLSLLTPSNLGTWAAIAVVSFGMGYATCHKVNSVADLKYQIAQLQQNAVIAREDAAQAEVDKLKLEELARKTKEAADALLDPNGECFSDADASKLRELWK